MNWLGWIASAAAGAVMGLYCYWRGYRTGKRHGCQIGRWAEKHGIPDWWDP